MRAVHAQARVRVRVKEVRRMWFKVTSPWVCGTAGALIGWFGWSSGRLASALSDRELRSEDPHPEFLAYVVIVGVVVIARLVAAAHTPGAGELLAGAGLSTIGLVGTAGAAVQLVRQGEIIDATSDRIAAWKPRGSHAALPFTAVLVAGVLLLVGSRRRVRSRARRSTVSRPGVA
jgi:hypothetical protein